MCWCVLVGRHRWKCNLHGVGPRNESRILRRTCRPAQACAARPGRSRTAGPPCRLCSAAARSPWRSAVCARHGNTRREGKSQRFEQALLFPELPLWPTDTLANPCGKALWYWSQPSTEQGPAQGGSKAGNTGMLRAHAHLVAAVLQYQLSSPLGQKPDGHGVAAAAAVVAVAMAVLLPLRPQHQNAHALALGGEGQYLRTHAAWDAEHGAGVDVSSFVRGRLSIGKRACTLAMAGPSSWMKRGTKEPKQATPPAARASHSSASQCRPPPQRSAAQTPAAHTRCGCPPYQEGLWGGKYTGAG